MINNKIRSSDVTINDFGEIGSISEYVNVTIKYINIYMSRDY